MYIITFLAVFVAIGSAVIVRRAAGSLTLQLTTAQTEAGLLAGSMERAVQSAERSEAARTRLEAELENIRLKRHTVPTIEMLEDLAAVLMDIHQEENAHAGYKIARIQNAIDILNRGRSGPHSYTPTTTEKRPARPGAGTLKLWT